MNFDLFAAELEEKKIEYIRDLDLSSVSTFKAGGVAPLAILPNRAEDVESVFAIADKLGCRVRVIGKSSNTFFCDGTLGSALMLTKKMNGILAEGEYITCGCGASLASVASYAAEHSLGGFEFASGIPGSMGGAMYMNAGAYGRDMGDVVCESLAYDIKEKKYIKITDHGFGYRQSIYKDRGELVCLSAKIRLAEGRREDILQNMTELARERRAKQPLEFPSCGSYFKRPEGDFAGRLIEQAGLKGTRIGGAEVSEKHAGFIVNRGTATASDILSLEELVRQRVFEIFGILLEREVEYIED